MDFEEIREQEEKGMDTILRGQDSGKSAGMSPRERFRRTMFFQKVDRIPNYEFGYWEQTYENFRQQGMPSEIQTESQAYEYFGIDPFPVNIGGNLTLLPSFEPEIIREDEEYSVYRDSQGFIAQINKKGAKSIPHYIEFPIKDRQSWEEFKKRLDPDEPKRIPENLAELAEKARTRDYPLSINFGSMAGVPRNFIGFEGIALMCYDDPDLLEDIVETLCRISCSVLSQILPHFEFDLAVGWEDICFNSGPIISPSIYEKIIMPRYQRITDLLHKHGVFIIMTDCDGNIMPILDIFLRGGINCMFPVEVNGGSDPVAMREKYGDKLLMMGGVDKMVLLKGPKAIEAELKRIEPVVRQGGFIPHIDHRVQADVTLENYKIYLKLKREIFNCGNIEPQYKE